MKISFENFGVIDKGEIEQKPLTILCGENNTGKTYAMYAMYGALNLEAMWTLPELEELFSEATNSNILSFNLLDFFKKNANDINNIIEMQINGAGLEFLFNNFSHDFSTSKNKLNLFDNDIENLVFNADILITRHHATLSKPQGQHIATLSIRESEENLPVGFLDEYCLFFLSSLLEQTFSAGSSSFQRILFPAERAGLNLFYSELNAYRTHILHKQRKDNFVISKYPKPIADYIDWLNLIPYYKNQKSELFADLSSALQNNILGGSYSFDETNSINFHLNNQKDTLPLHLTSSTVKTYFGLWFYLQHMAEEGDVLMIDEPELSLHPNNQRKIARLLMQLVNKGIKVVISTHSDYIVREFNSLLMLGHAKDEKSKKELMAKYNYQEDELLTKDKVGAYLFHNKTIDKMQITDDEGIIATTFDEVIHQLNQSSDDIYYSLKDNHE